jgi:hypothetical protein
MKAPVAEAARKDGSPSGAAQQGRAHYPPVRPVISSTFVTATVSDGGLAVCCCLRRFAIRVMEHSIGDCDR